MHIPHKFLINLKNQIDRKKVEIFSYFFNGFEVTVLKVAYAEWPSFEFNWVRHMWVWDCTQSGRMWIPRIKKNDSHFNVAIVSNRADHILTSAYTFGVDKVTGPKFWKWWCLFW